MTTDEELTAKVLEELRLEEIDKNVLRSELYFKLLGSRCKECDQKLVFDQDKDVLLVCSHIMEYAKNSGPDPDMSRFSFVKLAIR